MYIEKLSADRAKKEKEKRARPCLGTDIEREKGGKKKGPQEKD